MKTIVKNKTDVDMMTPEDLRLPAFFEFAEVERVDGSACSICCDCCLCETGGV